MSRVAIVCGIILIAIGLAGYFGSSSPAEGPAETDGAAVEPAGVAESDEEKKSGRSPTALIPAAIGLLLLICGLLGLKPDWTKHAMHAAAGVALLGGLAGLGRGLPATIQWLGGDGNGDPRTLIFVWLMTLVCIAFVVLAIRSFLAARAARGNSPDANSVQ